MMNFFYAEVGQLLMPIRLCGIRVDVLWVLSKSSSDRNTSSPLDVAVVAPFSPKVQSWRWWLVVGVSFWHDTLPVAAIMMYRAAVADAASASEIAKIP